MSGSDSMILRLEKELAEKTAFIEGIVSGAQDGDRDLTDNEKELTVGARSRIQDVEQQLELLYENRTRTIAARERADQVGREMAKLRHDADQGPVTYATAGAYLMDTWRAHIGDRSAADRIEYFERAAAHQKTSDNLGIVPDPIVGDVVNFIDGSRPLVTMLGTAPMTTATWYRPKVTQHTTVAKQGASGAAADEKTELTSQKMTITRLTGTATTYGGYVNVSRQDIDFSSPNALDTVVNDLSAVYAVQTEATVGALLATLGTTSELPGATGSTKTVADLANSLLTGLATIYGIVKGVGRYFLAVSPDKVGVWAPLFAPVNVNPVAPGMELPTFGNGIFGYPLGIPLVVSAGLPAGTIGVLTATSAVECFEQRVGQLQTIEPSVLGVQVAYAGYFTPVTIESTAAVRFIDAV
jgi:hypothetical protein